MVISIDFWPIPRRPSYLRRERRGHKGHQGSVWTAIQEEAGLLLGPGQGWHLEMGKHMGKYGEKWEHMTNTIENINMIQHILRDHVVGTKSQWYIMSYQKVLFFFFKVTFGKQTCTNIEWHGGWIRQRNSKPAMMAMEAPLRSKNLIPPTNWKAHVDPNTLAYSGESENGTNNFEVKTQIPHISLHRDDPLQKMAKSVWNSV